MQNTTPLLFIPFSLLLTSTTSAAPYERGQSLPSTHEDLRLAEPVAGLPAVGLEKTANQVDLPLQYVFRLTLPPVAEADRTDPVTRDYHANEIDEQQQAFLQRVQELAPTARVLARTRWVLNAVFLEVNPLEAAALQAQPQVSRMAPVGNYQIDLSETVPYVGASALQALDVRGAGVRVAVLDSGIDYEHADLGGSGDPMDYELNDPAIVEPDSFPTAKVVGGYDFVGGEWPVGPLMPDPDPIDDGILAGHGTHVADIIGGRRGVAPDVALYAVKVCSSVSTSCSGVALIQGMEFAVDPNGDGDPRDHVDIINMSLGSSYGQPFDDDLSFAVANATELGVLTVASAGNGSDRPYVTGTPSAAPSALSVAQTYVPSAVLPLMEVIEPADQAGLYPAVFQAWSAPLETVIAGPVTYGDGAGGNLNGCAPFAAGSLTGQLVFVDRGACFFSTKIRNIQEAGGALGIIGLVAPGSPFGGGFGGGPPISIPGFMISQADGDILRTGAAAVSFDPTNSLALVGSMVGSSSRGPNADNRLKPDIGAPGASVSASAGTGTLRSPFGGTSGAAPMVSGAAALLVEAFTGGPDRDDDDDRPTPAFLKALLMNSADADIRNIAAGGAAPVSRIGSGELRVDSSYAAPFVAFSDDDGNPALSFGFADVSRQVTLVRRSVRVVNLTDEDLTLRVEVTDRFANDTQTGAVGVSAPARIQVDEDDEAVFDVVLRIRGNLLRPNLMSSGSGGSAAPLLTANEYDGYLTLTGQGHSIHLPWHVLPRRAAKVKPERRVIVIGDDGTDTITMTNRGAGVAQSDAYTLLALSEDQPRGPAGIQQPTPDIRAIGVQTSEVPAGFCSSVPSFVWAFAINTWERQSHLLPVSHQVYLDTDRDGIDDFVVLNRDFSALSSGALNTISDGRQVTYAFDLSNGNFSAWYFAEHAMNTGNTVLRVCGEQVGLTGTDIRTTQVDVTVVAQDFYFGGPGDLVSGITITPGGERYLGSTTDLDTQSTGELVVTDVGPFAGNSDELGLLLLTNGDRGAASRGGATPRTEALLFTLPGVDVPTPLPVEDDDEDDEDEDDSER